MTYVLLTTFLTSTSVYFQQQQHQLLDSHNNPHTFKYSYQVVTKYFFQDQNQSKSKNAAEIAIGYFSKCTVI